MEALGIGCSPVAEHRQSTGECSIRTSHLFHPNVFILGVKTLRGGEEVQKVFRRRRNWEAVDLLEHDILDTGVPGKRSAVTVALSVILKRKGPLISLKNIRTLSDYYSCLF